MVSQKTACGRRRQSCMLADTATNDCCICRSWLCSPEAQAAPTAYVRAPALGHTSRAEKYRSHDDLL